jgi:hypothetical protein
MESIPWCRMEELVKPRILLVEDNPDQVELALK